MAVEEFALWLLKYKNPFGLFGGDGVKTKYSPLVKLKKSTMERSEGVLQRMYADLNSATTALKLSYGSLDDIEPPQSGSIEQLLASRTLLASQRALIEKNKEWVTYAQSQVDAAKQQLKADMIEYEKFQYLELEEIKKIQKSQKLKETKALDEIALMGFDTKGKR